MIKSFLMVCFVSSFAGCTHKKTALPEASPRTVSTDERTQKSHMELSYRDLSSILLTVMYTVDGHELGCPVKPHQLAPLSQSFQALLDERFASDLQMYSKMPKKQRVQFYPKDCQAQCNCGAYSRFADYLEREGIKMGAGEKAAVQKISSTQIDSSKNPAACLENEAPWVCDSKVFHSLVLE